MSASWGLCKNCKWLQIEPGASPENLTLGLCIEELLQPFRLRVSGNSGCDRLTEGNPAPARAPARLRPRPNLGGEGQRQPGLFHFCAPAERIDRSAQVSSSALWSILKCLERFLADLCSSALRTTGVAV